MIRITPLLVATASLHLCLATGEARCQEYADLADIQMYYEVRGHGDPVLLLHGGTGSGEAQWSKVAPIMASDYRLIIPDSRAQGRSTGSNRPITYDLLTDDVVALMDILGIESAHIVGSSDGGIIGLNMAMRYPGRVQKVVAYGANFRPSGLTVETTDYVRTVTPEKYLADNAETEWLSVRPQGDQFATMLDKITSMWLSQPNWTERDLAEIEKPVLIIDDTLGLTI